ncbi:MAG: 1-(5-phosphoribosyl)-5-[(5-phosphoribosylamino)methylideneamino]imidazole-4-carboxamide isomerase [Acutalibacteraceae bacterium]
MIIIPAIDLKDGNCVRLLKGDYSTSEKVAENPLVTAANFKKQGALRLHMVDLDGAKDGHPVNHEIIIEVARKSGMIIDVGGGIRDLKTIEYYLSHGVSKVILGSVAVKNQQIVTDAIKEFGSDKITVGIDAKNGLVKAEGWLEGSDINYIELAKRMEEKGVQEIIYTDIDKDGTLQGPNISELKNLSEAVSCNIIASGGVSNIKDIKNLSKLKLYGAICGKSLYSGSLDLNRAVVLASEDLL